MAEWAPDVAGRLEEIDRRLREIQAELVPGRVPRETRLPVSTPSPEPPPGPESATRSPEPRSAADQAGNPGAAEPAGDLGAGDPAGNPGADDQAGDLGAAEATGDLGADEPAAFEPREQPRGRSGPLAEALQRARNDRLAGLAGRPDVPSEEAVPGDSAQPLPEPASADPHAPGSAPGAADVAEQPPPDPRVQEQPQQPPEPASAASEQPPEPTAAEQSPPAPPRPLGRDARFDVLAELQSSLLTATRDLLDGYERASLGASEWSGQRLTLSAGPFPGTQSLRAFEQELARIRGVREVTVRGYQGRRRAIIEVELDGPDDHES